MRPLKQSPFLSQTMATHGNAKKVAIKWRQIGFDSSRKSSRLLPLTTHNSAGVQLQIYLFSIGLDLGSIGFGYPQGRFEVRRFRPNLVIETGSDAGKFPENEWNEKVLSLGNDVKIKITGACGRCVMTALAQGDLPRDVGVLKTAVHHNRAQVGAYASVLQGGIVHAGDSVWIEPVKGLPGSPDRAVYGSGSRILTPSL